jgi:hypothetical protein
MSGIALMVTPNVHYSRAHIDTILHGTLTLNRTLIQQHNPAAPALTTDTAAGPVLYQMLNSPTYIQSAQRTPVNFPKMTRPMQLQLQMIAANLFNIPDTTDPHQCIPTLLDAIHLGYVHIKPTRQYAHHRMMWLPVSIRDCLKLSTQPPSTVLRTIILQAPMPVTFINKEHLHTRHPSYNNPGHTVKTWRIDMNAIPDTNPKLEAIAASIMIPKINKIAAAIEWCVEQDDLWHEYTTAMDSMNSTVEAQ